MSPVVPARTVHRDARAVFAPIFTDAGFGRLRGTSTAAWQLPVGDQFVVGWVQPSTSWDAFGWFGTQFTVEFRYGPDPGIGMAGPSFRFCELLDSRARRRIRDQQNRVIAKMPPPPSTALAQLADDAATTRWYLATGSRWAYRTVTTPTVGSGIATKTTSPHGSRCWRNSCQASWPSCENAGVESRVARYRRLA